MTQPRKISNSEVSSWLACSQRYYYEYDLGLSPNTYSQALTRGIVGHEAMAAYYTHLMGNPTQTYQAQQLAMRVLGKYMASDGDITMLTELAELIQLYWTMVDDSDWEIVAVEREVNLPLTERFEYVLRLDMLVKSRSTGKYILVDHKFVYDFWSYDDLQLSPQFPKYIATLKAKGIDISHCVLNQLRYRKIKVPTFEMKFARTEQVVSKAKMTNAMSDQIKVSKRIMQHRELPEDEKQHDVVRSLNKVTCKYCTVKPLCLAEYDGGDTTYMVQNDFTTSNSYGYNKTESSQLV